MIAPFRIVSYSIENVMYQSSPLYWFSKSMLITRELLYDINNNSTIIKVVYLSSGFYNPYEDHI